MTTLIKPNNLKFFEIEDSVMKLAASLLKQKAGTNAVAEIVKNATFPFDEFVFKSNSGFLINDFHFKLIGLMKCEGDFSEYSIEATGFNSLSGMPFAFNSQLKLTDSEIGIFKERFKAYNEFTNSYEDEFLTDERQILVSDVLSIICTLCQIVARKDLTEKETVDYSKLNKKRAKTGKPPLPTMTRIVLKRSAEELAKNTIQMHAVNADPTERGKRRLHDVRSHIRLKNGKIEIVRAHKRGDASLGYVEQLRIVK